MITLNEIKSHDIQLLKKLIIVNSSDYTDEGFDYILDLADKFESIVFVQDKKQIYTHGTWFGSDIFSDTTNIFSKFNIVSSNGESSIIGAKEFNDTFTIKGIDGIELHNEVDKLTERNTINVKYDVNHAIDENKYIDLGEAGKLSLTIEEGKINLKKYNIGNVTLSQLPILEYDLPDQQLEILVNVNHPDKFEFIDVFTDNGYDIRYDSNSSTIFVTVPTNTDTEIGIEYFYDGKRSHVSVIQEWGYAWCFGTSEITVFNFDMQRKYIETSFTEKEIEINQAKNLYGWFAYPKNVNINFVDEDSSIAGGWKKMGTFINYSNTIEYQVYRTVHEGLGRIKWHIYKKERQLLNGRLYI